MEQLCFLTFRSDSLSLPTEVTEFVTDSNGSSSSPLQIPQTYFVYYTGREINCMCVVVCPCLCVIAYGVCVCVCVFGVLQMEIIKKIKIMVGREPFRPSPERPTVPAPGCGHRHQNTGSHPTPPYFMLSKQLHTPVLCCMRAAHHQASRIILCKLRDCLHNM